MRSGAAGYAGVFCLLMMIGGACHSEDDMSNSSKLVTHRAVGAGRWFTNNTVQLTKMVNGFMDSATPPAVTGRIVSAIAPHAGYVYSGRTAGYTYHAIRDNLAGTNAPETVVIVGFSHSMGFRGIALMDGDAIETPVGTAQLDKDASVILCAGRSRIVMDYRPHDGEHSAENQIPFVQVALPNAKLVVAMFGDHEMATLKELAAGLDDLSKKRRILVIASTDLLHDPDYDLVSKTDKETLGRIAALDEKSLTGSWKPDHQVCCGLMPVLSAIQYAKSQACKSGAVLYYRNNGDDDPSSRGSWVVGYGSVVFASPK